MQRIWKQNDKMAVLMTTNRALQKRSTSAKCSQSTSSTIVQEYITLKYIFAIGHVCRSDIPLHRETGADSEQITSLLAICTTNFRKKVISWFPFSLIYCFAVRGLYLFYIPFCNRLIPSSFDSGKFCFLFFEKCIDTDCIYGQLFLLT